MLFISNLVFWLLLIWWILPLLESQLALKPLGKSVCLVIRLIHFLRQGVEHYMFKHRFERARKSTVLRTRLLRKASRGSTPRVQDAHEHDFQRHRRQPKEVQARDIKVSVRLVLNKQLEVIVLESGKIYLLV